MIKAIIFDYVGVLVGNFGNPFYNCLNKLTKKPTEEIKNTFRKHWNKLKIGKIDDNAFWKEMSKELTLSPQDIEEAKKVALKICEPKKETLDLVKQLSKKYDLYLLSNSCYGWSEHSYNTNGLKLYFKHSFFSHNLKLAKPDPKIYQYALKKTHLKPEEIIYVDDKIENVNAAKKLGMHGILFKDLNSFKESLNLAMQ